jgi:hypothetical protein
MAVKIASAMGVELPGKNEWALSFDDYSLEDPYM